MKLIFEGTQQEVKDAVIMFGQDLASGRTIDDVPADTPEKSTFNAKEPNEKRRNPTRSISEIDALVFDAVLHGHSTLNYIKCKTGISWDTVNNSVTRLIKAGKIEDTANDGLIAVTAE